jgi:hypothetical protein
LHSQSRVRPRLRLRGRFNRPAVIGLLLVIATVALYYPAHRLPFVMYDDNDYVFQNQHLQSGLDWTTVRWAMTAATAANWHPLTWLSHALDWQLFGLDPAGHHDENVFLHALNALLLFWVLQRATGFADRSFMVAALFAFHPINVESVAWISERKNLLSMVFFLLALGAYRWYALRPRVGRYSAVALLFTLGLMAKPQIITLPCVLLLWDYWPLGRMFPPTIEPQEATPATTVFPAKNFPWLVVEKLPLLVVAVASAVITLKVQTGARLPVSRLVRAGNAVLSYGLYIKKAIWPIDLALLYPHPGAGLNWWKVAAAGLVLPAITLWVIDHRQRRYLLVGWLWFLGTLVPMIGLIQVGTQAMADRYAYLSFVGLFIILCWGISDYSRQKHLPAFSLPCVSIAGLLVLALLTRRQIAYWQTDEALWGHTVQVTTHNLVAESELGTALALDGKVEQALPHFHNALAISPSDTTANMGLAIYALQNKDFSDAILHYQRVVKDKRTTPAVLKAAWSGMAKAYAGLGDRTEAKECREQADAVTGP